MPLLNEVDEGHQNRLRACLLSKSLNSLSYFVNTIGKEI